jgi:DNA modification methylase
VTPYFSDGQVTLLHGHVIDQLRTLPSESVQCVVTSPPYWALRSYGTEAQVWGGDPEHEHEWSEIAVGQPGSYGEQRANSMPNKAYPDERPIRRTGDCPCGAWRGELGHEPTPQMFVQHLVDVFREVRGVLKSDGCCFVNIGDGYAGSGKGPSSANGLSKQHTNVGSLIGPTPSSRANRPRNGLSGGTQTIDESYGAPTSGGPKAKDLVLIPERFALAMQDDGWYVRSRIAWCKRAPMPESVRDRPTNAWEHIWMLTKSARYFWDADAVREDYARVWNPDAPNGKTLGPGSDYTVQQGQPTGHVRQMKPITPSSGRNMWSYWLLSPDPEPLAHFATFPREIPRRCIAAATREGDTVLDPFVGSGTTTMVARSMLRRSIGIDLSEEYLRTIALKKNAQMALMATLEPTA